ncbi:hypothetical protein [Flavobacterium ginsengiterrae]|uniref:Uncharacterized protein n=1 Tax=Flavobacterium ginsengiterrae TaxID=871695 RepID=A0ABP7G604_9FLAO
MAQEGFNRKISYALETYAFLKGQDAALEKVAGQFPELSADVRAAEKKLDKVYCIQGSTLPSLTAVNLEPMIRKNEKLFRLIADRTDLDN